MVTVQATAPLRDAQGLPPVLAGLAAAPPVAMLVAALLTWLAHSSLAVVLLLCSLAANHLLAPDLALALVLGANLGGSLVAVLMTAGAGNRARRVPCGNLLMRLLVAALLLPLLPAAAHWLALLEPDPSRQIIAAHLGFNLALAGAMLPVLGWVARGLERLLPDQAAGTDGLGPRYPEADAVGGAGLRHP
jgi:phosphate:Na+ symporter